MLQRPARLAATVAVAASLAMLAPVGSVQAVAPSRCGVLPSLKLASAVGEAVFDFTDAMMKRPVDKKKRERARAALAAEVDRIKDPLSKKLMGAYVMKTVSRDFAGAYEYSASAIERISNGYC